MTADLDLDELYAAVSNWGRWGEDDEAGALAFITPQARLNAMASVRQGVTVSLARDLMTRSTAEQPSPAHHHMLASGDSLDASGVPGYEATRDYLGTEVHGLGTTHLDALCHMFVAGRMYNDRLPSQVTSTGAASNTVMASRNGIVGRGVLLDVPLTRDVDYLASDELVTISDLEAAEAAQDVRVSSGDVLIVSIGRDAARSAGRVNPFGEGLPGLHPECLRWLHQREVAVLAGDGISDAMPARTDTSWPFPIHQIAITSMGLHLVDNLRLDELIELCRRDRQWSFLIAVTPLRIPGGTGCPVNPVAVL